MRVHERDLWYVSVVHVARPLTDPAALVAWCDAHRDVDFGPTTADAVDIVRPVFEDVRLETLHVPSRP